MSQKFLFVLWPTFDELMTLCTNILLAHFREKYLTDCRQTWYLASMYYSPDLIRFWCTMAYFWRSYDVFLKKKYYEFILSCLLGTVYGLSSPNLIFSINRLPSQPYLTFVYFGLLLTNFWNNGIKTLLPL